MDRAFRRDFGEISTHALELRGCISPRTCSLAGLAPHPASSTQFGLTPNWDPLRPSLLDPLDQPSLGRAAQFGEWGLKLWNKIKIWSRNQPITLWMRRRGLERADPSNPNHCSSAPRPPHGSLWHRDIQASSPWGCPWHRAWSWHCFHSSTKAEKKGEKKPQVNKKKPICKYCKECVFSYVLLLSPFVSYQQTSCQLGEVPAYFFFPVKCFSMPERIKMNVNEVY